MKKSIKILAALAIALGGAFTLAACDDEEPNNDNGVQMPDDGYQGGDDIEF